MRENLIISSKDEKYIFRASSRKNLFLGFELLTKEDANETATEFPENLKEKEELILKEINLSKIYYSSKKIFKHH